MNHLLFKDHNFWLFITLYTVLCAVVFSYMLYYHVPSDINAHTQILMRFVEVDSFPTPPIYYSLVYLLHFIMPYKEGYGMAAMVVLTAAGFLKYGLSYKYLITYCSPLSQRTLNIFTFSLMFFAPITLFYYEGELWYLAKFTPLIWHNSTTLLSLPFCVLLFYLAVRYLETRSPKLLWRILAVAILIVLIKPSFVFPFLPAFPLAILLVDRRWSIELLQSILLIIPLVAIIVVEKALIYNVNPIESHLEEGIISGIGIHPFFLWKYYSETPIWDVVSSFLFPLTFVAFSWRRLFNDPHFILGLLLVMFAFMIYFTLIETGPRMMDGNFFWQVILTLFVFNLVLVKHLLNTCFYQKSAEGGVTFRGLFLLILFFIHVVGGITYTIRIILTHCIF